MRLAGRTIVLAAVGCLAACSTVYDDGHEGKLADRSYGGQLESGTCLERPDAHGNRTCIDRFAGRFVWTDYAAPWCAPCAVQARVIEKLETEFGDEIVFLTVMTSASAEPGSMPTIGTARDWSLRFGLEPSRVVVADNLWGMLVPTHVL